MIKPQDKARQLRPLIIKASTSLDDKDASMGVELFPHMYYDGSLISYKTRINWDGIIKMAAQDLWDIEENNPINSPSLWKDINYRDGIRVIPENISAADAFSLNEKGWWRNILMISLLDNNVWTPSQYPQGWEEFIA